MENQVTSHNDAHPEVPMLDARRVFDGDDPCWAVVATQPTPHGPAVAPPAEAVADPQGAAEFVPLEPRSLERAGLTESQVESLVFKYLLSCGAAQGRQIADQVALPFQLLEPMFRRLKHEQLIVYKAGGVLSDYVYELTDLGVDRARRYSRQSLYFGAAPVSLEEYSVSVSLQSVKKQQPSVDSVRQAFGDLVLSDDLLGRLGEGMTSGMGFFLYGDPGNGKTSIAERVTQAYGETVWIPRAIHVGGEVIRLFDPVNHEERPMAPNEKLAPDQKIDKRWVRIRRPTIVVGGELTMDQLEVTSSSATGINEAPLQMKSNCGTLVIDDFGRQRFDPAVLLNRWIVPLEKRADYLSLPSGRMFSVPFDQLVVFSTNLDPRDLVDEAFLRRIPYKVDVPDPTESQFLAVFRDTADKLGIAYSEETLDYLLEKHYRSAGRQPRFCHPRDLLQQILNFCKFRKVPAEVTPQTLDAAVKNYLMLQSRIN